MPTPCDVIKPIRIPRDLHVQIQRVSKITGLSEAELIRQATKRGLPVIERALAEPQAA